MDISKENLLGKANLCESSKESYVGTYNINLWNSYREEARLLLLDGEMIRRVRKCTRRQHPARATITRRHVKMALAAALLQWEAVKTIRHFCMITRVNRKGKYPEAAEAIHETPNRSY